MKVRMNYRWIYWFLGLFGLFFLTGAIVATIAILAVDDVVRALWVLPGVFGTIGLALILVGVVLAVKKKRRDKRDEGLKAEGICLMAKYMGCEPNYNVLVNGAHPLTLRCGFDDGYGKTHIFRCKNLRYDIYDYLKDGVVYVYCNRDNYDEYFVDVEGSIGPGVIEH